MKISLATLALAAVFSPALVNAANVSFEGEIINATCSVDTASQNMVVDLGKIDASSLGASGAEAGHTNMEVVLNCTAAGQDVALKFGSLTNADPTTGDLKLTGSDPASNVQLRIYNRLGEQQRVNGQPTDGSKVTTTIGAVKLDYTAVYRAIGVVRAGAANTDAVFSVVYP